MSVAVDWRTISGGLSIPTWHRVSREWIGATAFIVGGGTSVLQQETGLLRGQNVIAINSSYERIPFASYLIYSDPDWWREHRFKSDSFKGSVIAPVAQLQTCNRRLFMRKRNPPGITNDPSALAMRNTTFTAAINLAVHLGVKRIVLLGADGRMGADQNGNPISHHHASYPSWKFNEYRWCLHRDELRTLVAPLISLGIEVLNASPQSAWDIWPIVRLEDCL